MVVHVLVTVVFVLWWSHRHQWGWNVVKRIQIAPAWDGVIVLIMTSAAMILFSQLQPITGLNDGKGWDGLQYYTMSEQIQSESEIAVFAPFVNRVGVPWLVAKIAPNDLMWGYRLVNSVASVMVVWLLHMYIGFFVRSRTLKFVLVGSYILTRHAIIRSTAFFPVSIDPMAMALLLLGLILVEQFSQNTTFAWGLAIVALVVVGVVVREIVLIIAVLPLLAKRPLMRDGRLLHMPPLLHWGVFVAALIVGLALLSVVNGAVTPTSEYRTTDVIMLYLFEKPMSEWILSVYIAFGAVFLTVLFFPVQAFTFLREHQHMFFYMALFWVMGYLAGTDTERIMYWSFPVFFSLVGYLIENNWDVWGQWYVVGVVLFSQLSQMMVFTPISVDEYLNWVAYYMPHEKALNDVFFFLALSGMMAIVFFIARSNATTKQTAS